ncbi:MAG TPA: hypothetical protein VIX63_10570 [Vicinamibacterales bacterium]
MATQEQRVAQLEAGVQEHSLALSAMRETLVRVEQRMDRVELRMDRLEQRMDVRFDAVDRRFERLEDRIARQFVWMAGIQVTTLLAIVVAMFQAVIRAG